MAIKTFSVGEVLTANDTNTFLANSGLVYIDQKTISGTTTNVSSVFTSTYDNYRVLIQNPTNTAAGEFYLKYLTGTTTVTTTSNYFWAYRGWTSGGAGAEDQANSNANGFLGWTTAAGGGQGAIAIDIFAPNMTQRTIANVHTTFLGSGVYGVRVGILAWDTTTAFTGFQITSGGGSTLTGTVTVYGYRKP